MHEIYIEEPLVGSLINQLIDISAPTTSLYHNGQAIDGLCLKWNDIFSTLSRILGFWKGKKAAAIEDLVVERYVFALCWDYPTMATASDKLLPLCTGPQDLDFSDMVQFFFFAHSFLGQCGTFGEGTNFPRLVVGLLEQLSAVPILEEIEELDFCRPIRKLS
jgi:E3 ubiquitin-protein ligase UBR4